MTTILFLPWFLLVLQVALVRTCIAGLSRMFHLDWIWDTDRVRSRYFVVTYSNLLIVDGFTDRGTVAHDYLDYFHDSIP